MNETLQPIAAWLDGVSSGVSLVGIILLAVSMAICCLTLIGFPEVADRAIAFDLFMILVVGIIALSAIVYDEVLLLDALIVVAVLGFLGTVTIARYLERGLPAAPRNGTRDAAGLPDAPQAEPR
jgi:multicomponent Na+:H+ antiporter subunit F